MTAADLDALIGPAAPGRERVVMRRRGPDPARIHPDYRALLDSPLPQAAELPPGSTAAALIASAIGLVAAALLVAVLAAL